MSKKEKSFEVAVYGGHMLSRLKAFTDAIMSIVATIMILEIRLPNGNLSQLSSYGPMFSSLTIYIVSFLVIVSFYFETIKVFARIKEITGWQVFAYSIFLMVFSLFPLMTQIETELHGVNFLLVYILYIVAISRSHDALLQRLLIYNKDSRPKLRVLRTSYYLVLAAAILLSFTSWDGYSGFLLLWIPVRSLIKSVVVKE